MASIKKQRNIDQLTQAQFFQTYLNSHLKEDVQKYDDLSIFLPHPATYKAQNTNRTLNISRATAIAVLQSMSWLDSSVIAALDSWLTELEIIAKGE